MKFNNLTAIKSKKGFTLLEAIIAASLLAIGCFGILGMLTTSQASNVQSEMRTNAIALAERILVNVEVEARQASIGANTRFADKLLASADGTWIAYNPNQNGNDSFVNDFGQLQNGTNDTDKKYCAGFYVHKRGTKSVSGILRLFWRKDGNNLTTECSGSASVFPIYDELISSSISDDKKVIKKATDFVSFPYSIDII